MRTNDPRLPAITYRRDRGSLILAVLSAAVGVAAIAVVVVLALSWNR